MTKLEFIKNITCDESKMDCTDGIISKLELKFNCKLYARKSGDIVNGSVSVYHVKGAHEIMIEFYDNDEPINKKHSSPFKKLLVIPNKRAVEDEIMRVV